jgi:hypothetical protein
MKISSVLKEIKANLKRGVYKVFYKKQDGSMGEFFSAKRGNSAYASRTGKKIEIYRQGFFKGAKNKIIIFITLTIPYDKSYYGCEKSWLFFKKELSPFVRSLKKLGLEKYIISLESCKQGGCPAHLLTRWKKPLQTENKELFNLTEKIKEKWINRVKKTYPHTRKKNLITLEICQNLSDGKNLFNYVFKWIGKYSNIEKALERVQSGAELKNNDIPRLFSNYWGYRLKIRLFRTSRGLASTI